MGISLSNVTGAAQTGLTTPGYTVAVDQAPDVNAKQWYVSALTGTQTGVTVHSASSPFTVAFWRSKILKTLGALGLNGTYASFPTNTIKCVVRKGVTPAAGQAARPMVVRIEVDCPAGAETYDPNNVRAGLSCAFGAIAQQSSGFGDSVVSGSL